MVDVQKQKVVEDGKKYFMLGGFSGGWKLNVESSNEEKMNNDVLKL
jgi:hypothetical protein